MKIIFCCLLIFNIAIANAAVDKSVEGSIVLSSGEVKVGKLVLHLDHDVILFSEGDKRMVYAAHKIKAVYYYDEATNINRRLVSLKQHLGSRSMYRLFEVVLGGDVKVLRQQKYSLISAIANPLDYNYYVYQNETLIRLEDFRKEVYPRLNAQSGFCLDKFATENRIKATYPIREIAIIEYYNKLQKPEPAIARY